MHRRAAPNGASALAPLRVPIFLAAWVASAVSSVGTWMQNVTVPYLAYQLTDSTVALSAAIAANYVPAFLVTPWSGALCDRYGSRRVLLAANALQMASASALAGLWASGVHRVDLLLVFVVLFNLGGGLHIVAWQTAIPSLVSTSIVAGAVRLNAMQNTLARAVGPGISGVVLATLGPGAAFTGNALSYVGVLAVLLRLPRGAPRATARVAMVGEMRAGWSHVRANAVAWQATVTIAIFSATAYSVVQMAPVVAEVGLGVGRDGYARLLVAHGVGAVVGTAFIALAGDRVRRSSAIVVGLATGVAGTTALAFASNLAAGFGCFVAIGLGQTVLSVSQNTAVLVQAESGFRGRVVSIYLMAIIGGLPVGSAVLGALARRYELSTVILLAAGSLLVHGLRATWKSGRFRAFDASGPPEPHLSVATI